MHIVLVSQGIVTVPVEFSTAGVGSIEELYEAHSIFDEATGEDAVAGETSLQIIPGIICAIHLQDMSGFGREVADTRDTELHAGSQFVACDSSRERAFPRMVAQVLLIQILQKGPQHPCLGTAVE